MLAMTKTQNLRRIVGWSVIAILLVFLGWYVADARDEIGAILFDIEVAWILPLLLVLWVINLFSAGLWASLVRSMEKRLSMARLIAIWHQSLLGKYIPGSIWVHVGRIYHLRQAGMAIKTAVYASAIEQMTVLASSAFVVALSPKLFLLLGLPGWTRVLLLPALVVSIAPNLVATIIWKLGIRRVDLRLAHVPARSFMIIYFGGHVIRALFGGGTIMLLLLILGHSSSELNVFDLASIGAASFAIGYMSLLTPGGIGVKEGVLVYLLGQFVPLPVAVLVAISGRLWPLLADGLGVVIGSLYLRWKRDEASGNAVLKSTELS